MKNLQLFNEFIAYKSIIMENNNYSNLTEDEMDQLFDGLNAYEIIEETIRLKLGDYGIYKALDKGYMKNNTINILLQVAAKCGSIEYMNYALKQGAVISNRFILFDVLDFHDLNMIKLLVENGAMINIYGVAIISPLIIATRNNDTDIVKYLIDNGANLNIRTVVGATPFKYAAINNNLDLMKYIVDHGADVKKSIMEILPVVKGNNFNEVYQYLLELKKKYKILK
jgi:ankyrin repeat protein